MNDKSDKTLNLNGMSMLDISGASAFIVPEGNCQDNMRMSVGPSDLGQSLLPYLSVEHLAAESQCDIWSVAEIAQKEERVRLLEE